MLEVFERTPRTILDLVVLERLFIEVLERLQSTDPDGHWCQRYRVAYAPIVRTSH